jgi:hypothetical protein
MMAMSHSTTVRSVLVHGACCALLTVLTLPSEAPIAAPSQKPNWTEERDRLQALGESHASAADLYEFFKKTAKAPKPHALPDWKGLWSRTTDPYFFDPDQKNKFDTPTASLTPKYKAELAERIRLSRDENKEFDTRLPLCLPPGMPRWFSEPFMREFVITPDQVWLMNEIANETRRVYTDGRAHVSRDDAVATYDGDSVGFWDGDSLIVHTMDMLPGQLQRLAPEYSESMEVVERWRKVNATHIYAEVWLYDPVAFTKPWFTRQRYEKISNPDLFIRVHYYDCVGTKNSQVKQSENGSSQFTDIDSLQKGEKKPEPTKKDQK